MARPVSQVKLGFYPTPPTVVEMLCIMLPRPQGTLPGPVSVLDNFGGRGHIGARLAEHLAGHPYFVELDKGRAAECAAAATLMGGQALNAPAETLKTTGGFSAWIFNPPYDFDKASGGRLETYLWQATVASAAKPGTLCILILPQPVVGLVPFMRQVYRWIEDPKVFRFPDPEYAVFKQVVVIGYARAKPLLLQNVPPYFDGQNDFVYPRNKLGGQPKPSFPIRNFQAVTVFESTLPNWETVLEESNANGVRAGRLWADFMKPRTGMGAFKPLMELSSGKAALLTAAGMANSTRIGDDVLKGSTRTYLKKIERSKDAGGGQVTPQIVEREVYAQVLTLFNLVSGDLKVLDSHDTPEAYNQYILDHAEELIANIRAKYPPLYKGDLAPWADLLARIEGPKRLPGIPPGLLPLQQHVAVATALGSAHAKFHFSIGEMGTGKTTTMIAATHLSNAARVRAGEGYKCVVLIPGHLVKKWKREVEAVLRNFGARAVIIGEKRLWPGGVMESRPLADVRIAMKAPGIVYLILSKETAKNGSPWAGRARKRTKLMHKTEVVQSVDGPRRVTRTHRYTLLACPNCGVDVTDAEGEPLFDFPRDKKGKEKSRWRCQACAAPLYTMGEAGGSYEALSAYAEAYAAGDWNAWPPRTPEAGKKQLPVGFRRVAVAEYISQHFSDRYDAIFDELHQYKAEDSDQAYASVDLAAGARRVIMGTGTPYGGKASTIFYLLYRSIPWFRKLYTHKDEGRFVEHFGLIETVYTSDKSVPRTDSSMGYARTADWKMATHEIPGAHPVMASLMLPYAGFMRLSDMGVELPEYIEQRVPVSLGAYEQTVAGKLAMLAHVACTPKAQGFSAFRHAALGWPDLPEQEVFAFKDDSTGELPSLVPPADGEWPKVKVVADMIQAERGRGRTSIIYLDQVHRRDTTGLYERALQARGLSTFILRSNTSGEEREELIDEASRRGVDTMITNGSLVETGLDLVYFSSIYRVQPITSFYKENQQDRRIWRLGQTKPCYIYWVYYDYPGSVQALTVALMARKLRAALLMNGDLAEGLATTEDIEDDFLQELMRSLLDATQPNWEGLPGVVMPVVIWNPAWMVAFDEWRGRTHEIVPHARGQVFVRPGAKPVLWPKDASRDNIIAWQYRDEILKAKAAGARLPTHALEALEILPALPGEKRVFAVPKPVATAPVNPAPTQGNFPGATRYELRSLGNGMLELRNGGISPTRVVWLGGERLSGPAEAVATIRKHFAAQLVQAKPTKKWSVQR